MKRYLMSTMSVILILLWCAVGVAFAAGKRTADPNNRNLAYNSPDKASATCTTATVTKGAIATVTVAGYSQMCWEASDSNNAAKRIKRHIGTNTAYLPGTGGCLGLNDSMGTIVFKPYSSTAAAYTVCYELEKGGKTP